jgi:hypothetical protein
VVAFVKDGNLLVWDEATGQSQTIFDSGDVIHAKLSDDGQLAAFLRRSYFAAGGFDRNEQSALWVVGRDGSNPHELVSVAALRALLNAAEADSTNFPRLEWIPNSHRLLYSGNTYEALGYGEGAHTPLRGVYLVDADSLANLTLAPADIGPAFVASPDGQQVALVTPTDLSFVNADGSRLRPNVLTYPAKGVPQPVTPFGVWTQDSSAFLVAAPVETGTRTFDKLTIWRVPVEGAQAQALVTVNDSNPQVAFAPDGSATAIVRESPQSRWGASATFIVPLPENLGPLATPGDTMDYSRLVWSPASSGYIFDVQTRMDLHPLCPNAGQVIELCGPPIHIPLQIDRFEWIDRSRFLYVTTQPRGLYLGSLDGSETLIVEDLASFDAVAATCTNDSEFVTDVTVPDGTSFAPGTIFRKTWRVRNSGACTWDAGYRLAFLSGDRLSGPRGAPLGSLDVSPEIRTLFPTVQPGEEVDVSVTLIAPAEAGTYQGQWQLFTPDGKPFGARPYVVIQVP